MKLNNYTYLRSVEH